MGVVHVSAFAQLCTHFIKIKNQSAVVFTVHEVPDSIYGSLFLGKIPSTSSRATMSPMFGICILCFLHKITLNLL